MKFLSCFRRPLEDPERPLLNDGYQAGCVFCTVSKDNGFAVEYEVGDVGTFSVGWHERSQADTSGRA